MAEVKCAEFSALTPVVAAWPRCVIRGWFRKKIGVSKKIGVRAHYGDVICFEMVLPRVQLPPLLGSPCARRSDTPKRVRDTGRRDLPPCRQRGDTLTKLYPQTKSCN